MELVVVMILLATVLMYVVDLLKNGPVQNVVTAVALYRILVRII